MPACWHACRIVVPGATSISWPSIVTLGIELLCRLPRCGGAVFVDATLQFGAEMADQPLNRPHRAVGQRADRVPLDFARHLFEHVDLGDRSIADDHPLHDAPRPAAAFAARRTLAAALMLIELREPCD